MRDGHVHTRFCPHGTNDSFEAYIEKALSLGITEITFTEHAPLPPGFVDPTPLKDSAMKMDDLHEYLEEIESMKSKYHNRILIHAGLEVDYIEGFEEETTTFLDTYGPRLSDCLLSVHFLERDGIYDCVDYSPELFGDMIERYGDIEAVYQKYFDTVKKSIVTTLGKYKPKRMGHITLVRKFQKKYPCQSAFDKEISNILRLVSTNGYELDYNGAGVMKPLCLETYPPREVVMEAVQLGIPLVYGSDAHSAKQLMQGYTQLRYK